MVVNGSLIKRPSAGSRFFLPQSDFFLEFDEVLELKLHAVSDANDKIKGLRLTKATKREGRRCWMITGILLQPKVQGSLFEMLHIDIT